MRSLVSRRFVVALAALCCAPLLVAEDRALVVLFGPLPAEHAQAVAPPVANALRGWLQVTGSSAELRRAGLVEGQELNRAMAVKTLETSLLDAARVSAPLDAKSFLNALDRATYAASHRAGRRVLLLVAANMELNADARSRVEQAVEFCRANAIRVVLVDPTVAPKHVLELFATSTGGAVVAELKALDGQLLIVAPVAKPGSELVVAKSSTAKMEGLAVRARLLRKRLPWKPGSINSDLGPTNGAMIVSVPIAELKLDDKGGSSQARATLAVAVKNTDGKIVWQAKRDYAVKSAAQRVEERRGGYLCLIRQLQLPGGKYSVEATVTDNVAGKTGSYVEPLATSSILPGFSLSDAMFVRRLNESVDKVEGDQSLAYAGNSYTPLLEPVFHAGSSFNLELYFVMYPDTRGGQPHISVEILRGAQAVGRTELDFTDSLRDTTREAQDVGPGAVAKMGEQKSEFPYLVSMREAMFSAGDYEARVTVRQDKQTISRNVFFRVVD